MKHISGKFLLLPALAVALLAVATPALAQDSAVTQQPPPAAVPSDTTRDSLRAPVSDTAAVPQADTPRVSPPVTDTMVPADTTAQPPGVTGDSALNRGAISGDTAAAAGALTDAGILGQLYAGNTAEVTVASQALTKSSNASVKKVAQRLVDDHTANNHKIEEVATKLGTTLPPADPPAGASTTESAGALTGADFDRAFLADQIAAHETKLTKIRNELEPAAQSDEVKKHLSKTADTVHKHIDALRKAQASL